MRARFSFRTRPSGGSVRVFVKNRFNPLYGLVKTSLHHLQLADLRRSSSFLFSRRNQSNNTPHRAPVTTKQWIAGERQENGKSNTPK